MKKTKRTHYYIVWIEGFHFFRGEKIKSIDYHGNVEYTTKMTEAMRVKEKDVAELKHFLKRHGMSDWTLENAFVMVGYAPAGTILPYV